MPFGLHRIFYYLIPVLLTGLFLIDSGSGKNRISRSDRNSGRNRNFTNATPERTEIAENEKTELLVNLKGDT